ncbi:MAG: FRG domain-containing protein [Sphingomonas sp.]|nr:FRG domain-containing protein [Sphingomonas sp.]
MTAYADGQPNFKCYRGQRNVVWDNIPGLFRPQLAKLALNEKRAVRDLVSVHPAEFISDETMFDRLVRMQHFGLPTRLMDVSQNPLVALYFATDPGPKGEESDGVVTAFAIPEGREKYFDSDSVSCLANLSNMTAEEKEEIITLRELRTKGTTKDAEIARVNGQDVYKRLHQFIRAEKPYFLPIINPVDLFKPYYVHPKMSNRRILSQAGGFIIYGLLPPRKINYAHPIEETRFVIPRNAKEPLRKALELLGISDSTLFPELDRAANRIKTSYSA